MSLSIQFVRVVLGILCIFFAHFLGRSIARRLQANVPQSLMMRWALRTFLTALGTMWQGGLDALTIPVFALAALSAAGGFYLERRPKKEEEDLSHVIFPEDERQEKP